MQIINNIISEYHRYHKDYNETIRKCEYYHCIKHGSINKDPFRPLFSPIVVSGNGADRMITKCEGIFYHKQPIDCGRTLYNMNPLDNINSITKNRNILDYIYNTSSYASPQIRI